MEGDFKQNTSIDQENNNDDESSHIGDKQNPVDNVQNNTEKEQNSNLIVDETNISNLIDATNKEDVDDEVIENCPFCGLELGDVFLSVGGRDFHQHCFKCHICGKQIDGIFFTDENENFICPEDFKVKIIVVNRNTKYELDIRTATNGRIAKEVGKIKKQLQNQMNSMW